MKFRFDTRVILSCGFVALSVASGVFIVIASLNYNQLYPALSQLDVGVSKISFGNQIDASIFVSNPVDYTGLTVTGAILTAYFLSGNDYLFKNSTISGSTNSNRPIPPHADTMWDWNITLSSTQSSALSSFYTTHNNNVTAHYFLTVSVATFLQTQIGTSPFQKEAQLPLLQLIPQKMFAVP
jgi:hypothetical protein